MSRPSRFRPIRIIGVLFSAVLLAVVLLRASSSGGDGDVLVTADDDGPESRSGDPFPEPVRATTSRLPPGDAYPPSSAEQTLSDGVKVMGPDNGERVANGPRHPHPLTPEHESLFRENRLIASLNGAMDVRDFGAMREMNRQYRGEYPGSTVLQEGYDIIADCIERKDRRQRARARRYHDEERASTLRRYVRRYCLEP